MKALSVTYIVMIFELNTHFVAKTIGGLTFQLNDKKKG